MYHAMLDDFEKSWFFYWIWPCSSNNGVYLFRCFKAKFGSKGEKQMDVRKTTLLEFDGIEVCDSFAKDASFCNVLQQLLLLEIEDTCDQIWTIRSLLARSELSSDFWPIGICCHGKEKIATSKVTIDGQSILKQLLHLTCTAFE